VINNLSLSAHPVLNVIMWVVKETTRCMLGVWQNDTDSKDPVTHTIGLWACEDQLTSEDVGSVPKWYAAVQLASACPLHGSTSTLTMTFDFLAKEWHIGFSRPGECLTSHQFLCALILSETLALYKSFTYLLTYLLTYRQTGNTCKAVY